MNTLISSPLARLPKRRYRLGLVVLLAVVLAFGAFAFAPAAHAASQTAAQAEHCQIVVAKLQPGEQTSRVLSSQCVQGTQPLVAPLGSTLLMSWYKDANYYGASTLIYGYYGPCDSAGYGIAYVGNAWNDVISSFKVWNNCYYSRAYTNSNYGGTCARYHLNVPWVGSTMNDRISSFWLNSDVHYC